MTDAVRAKRERVRLGAVKRLDVGEKNVENAGDGALGAALAATVALVLVLASAGRSANGRDSSA